MSGPLGRFEEKVSRRARLWKDMQIEKILVIEKGTLKWDLGFNRFVALSDINEIA